MLTSLFRNTPFNVNVYGLMTLLPWSLIMTGCYLTKTSLYPVSIPNHSSPSSGLGTFGHVLGGGGGGEGGLI